MEMCRPYFMSMEIFMGITFMGMEILLRPKSFWCWYEFFLCWAWKFFLCWYGIFFVLDMEFFLCCAWNFFVGHGIFFCVGHGNLNLWNDLWGSANFFRGIILFVRILG